MTNEEKIKAMNTEELGKLLIRGSAGLCDEIEKCGSNCDQCVIDWLKAEAAPAAESAVTK